MLWPPPEPRGNDDGLDQGLVDAMEVVRKKRGKQLRKALGGEVKALKALGRSDFLRNYDDRIDAWSIATASERVVDMVIGPLADRDGQTSRRAMRQLDPIALTYVYLDQQFDLPAIAAVLSWTHRSVARWVADQVRP